MTGRGIDQILPRPSSPGLYERYVQDAREYVALAEAVNGPIPRCVAPSYIWGDALEELGRISSDARVVNLETSVTRADEPWPHKGIHYRMHPSNVGCLKAAGIDVCALANNHVLDFGYRGLEETLGALADAQIRLCGAGRSLRQAQKPARVDLPGSGSLLVFSAGDDSSGVLPSWGATDRRPGVDFLEDLSEDTAHAWAERIHQAKKPGDLAVASIHWGPNWGYDLTGEEIRFAQRLIDGGVDLVHGHSSHHPRPLAVYRGKLILFGCGDFLNDYEGISGYEEFRSDLRLMYFATLDRATGALRRLSMTPLQAKRFTLVRASPDDAQWLAHTLTSACAAWGTALELDGGGNLIARWS